MHAATPPLHGATAPTVSSPSCSTAIRPAPNLNAYDHHVFPPTIYIRIRHSVAWRVAGGFPALFNGAVVALGGDGPCSVTLAAGGMFFQVLIDPPVRAPLLTIALWLENGCRGCAEVFVVQHYRSTWPSPSYLVVDAAESRFWNRPRSRDRLIRKHHFACDGHRRRRDCAERIVPYRLAVDPLAAHGHGYSHSGV